MTVVIKPDPNEGNKFSVRGMHYTYGLHGIVLAVDYVSFLFLLFKLCSCRVKALVITISIIETKTLNHAQIWTK